MRFPQAEVHSLPHRCMGHGKIGQLCPLWVKRRNTRCEQMFSALPLKADNVRYGWLTSRGHPDGRFNPTQGCRTSARFDTVVRWLPIARDEQYSEGEETMKCEIDDGSRRFGERIQFKATAIAITVCPSLLISMQSFPNLLTACFSSAPVLPPSMMMRDAPAKSISAAAASRSDCFIPMNCRKRSSLGSLRGLTTAIGCVLGLAFTCCDVWGLAGFQHPIISVSRVDFFACAFIGQLACRSTVTTSGLVQVRQSEHLGSLEIP
jgi:hypothetical protein